ncbi:hypothetical protein B0H14DRAFT_3750863, partial [Mycena olivaceomarginata]
HILCFASAFLHSAHLDYFFFFGCLVADASYAWLAAPGVELKHLSPAAGVARNNAHLQTPGCPVSVPVDLQSCRPAPHHLYLSCLLCRRRSDLLDRCPLLLCGIHTSVRPPALGPLGARYGAGSMEGTHQFTDS